MAQSLLMKQGLEGILNHEKKFEDEARFGQNIYYVAWAVEILAAIIGFTIALAIAYDAYIKIQNPDTNDLINAIIAALPFVVIAVIEPTKIALAGGLYKTRILGWKLLILAALIALTIVTFETMFNGLERTLSNTTRVITDSENQLLALRDQKEKKTLKLKELQEKSIEELTKDLRIQMDELSDRYSEEIKSINDPSDFNIQSLEKLKSDKQKELDSVAPDSDSATRAQLQNIDKEIVRAEGKITELLASQKDEIKEETDRYNQNNQDRTRSKNLLLESLKDKVKTARQDLAASKTALGNLENQEADAKNSASERSKGTLKNLQSELDSTNILQRQKRQQLNEEIQSEKGRFQKEIEKIEKTYNAQRANLNTEIEQNETKLKEAEKELQDALNSSPGSLGSLDSAIKNIRDKWQKKINEQDKIISKLQQERQKIIDGQTGVDTRRRSELQAEIDRLQREMLTENKLRNSKLDRARSQFDMEMQNLKEKLKLEVNSIQNEKDNIQPLESEIDNLDSQINETKSVIREEIHKNQVYRMAALLYKRSDVVDVTRAEVTNVALVWFGSIAAITATMGTILALISFILRDPEAYVERPKFSITRRISVILRRLNKLLFACIKLITSISEIFRGLVGTPLQRAIRRTLLAYRKRLNKPRIEKVEVEVEKIIEKEVDKIVEVEVEKVVEVEVPVDKIVTKEVPVEIVRKEMVYVPLYSADSGLIDASTELKGAKPKISDNMDGSDGPQRRKSRSKSEE